MSSRFEDPELPAHIGRRKPAVMPLIQTGNLSEIIFVTVCTKDRKPILANPEAHRLLVEAWNAADHWQVGCYVIMPDHVHLFSAPAKRDALPVRRWISYWKSLVTQSWSEPEDKPLWLTHAWDTQLRHGDSYTGKWHYVQQNPVRHGLVRDAAIWPYQGVLNVLPWHDA
jgi:REP element-mobilizing transposase RayT